jgi:uncharacterized protein (UPF0261 family)
MSAGRAWPEKPLVTASMFGNTTACVDHARSIHWRARGYEVLVFHATGTGGKTMESLIADGYITGSLDITTTELADEVCGGVLSAGPERCLAAARAGIPTVLVARLRGHGQLLGRRDRAGEVPGPQPLPVEPQRDPDAHQRGREYPHGRDARRGGQRRHRAGRHPAAAGGVSMLDSPGGPSSGTRRLTRLLRRHQDKPQARHPGHRAGHNINDPEFADKATTLLLEMLEEA